MPAISSKPKFFATPAAFRDWLTKNHDKSAELWVGFHKKGSGKRSITWPESVDEALCFGWIDGVRKSIDGTSYVIRFTPRRPGSNWSLINCNRVAALKAEGRMRPSGLRAFGAKVAAKSGVYTYEQRREATFDGKSERQFKGDSTAWKFFQSQPPWYRRTATRFVLSAKKEETRQRRLSKLIQDSHNGVPIRELRRPTGKK